MLKFHKSAEVLFAKSIVLFCFRHMVLPYLFYVEWIVEIVAIEAGAQHYMKLQIFAKYNIHDSRIEVEI